ncbi:MAG: cytochrome c3 family protein [Pseudomonadota bacterium]
MKQYNKLLIGLAAGLLILSGSASAAVVGSKHDMTTATGAAVQTTAATDQVCVFCHTPHGSDATVTAAPLWNKSLPLATAFTEYTSSTMDGAADLTSSVSLACLSCHDGTQAMDTVLNAPTTYGPDNYNYNAAGAEISLTEIAAMAGTPVPVLGTDLQNDHPVSMPYGGGGAAFGAIVAAGATIDTAFEAVSVSAGGQSFADDGINTLPLYDKGGVAFVECASCHDPHGGIVDTPFLRVSNAGSAVCVTCHVK